MNLAIAMHDPAHVKAIATALRYPFDADPAIANRIQSAILEAIKAKTAELVVKRRSNNTKQQEDTDARYADILSRVKDVLKNNPGIRETQIGLMLGVKDSTLRNYMDKMRGRNDIGYVANGNVGSRYYLLGEVPK